MENNFVIMLVGVPASGKSTFLKNDNTVDAEVLSTDNLIEEYAASQGKTYSEVFKEYVGIAEKEFFNKIKDCVDNKRNFFVDRTNISKKSRRKILALIPDSWTKIAVVFSVPDEQELSKRLSSRPGKHIPDFVIESMIDSYERPTQEEGFSMVLDSHILK